MAFRQTALRRSMLAVHRWLGLGSSAVLILIGATGMLIAVPYRPRLPRLVGVVHETLALGSFGSWLVIGATLVSILLEIGGLYLWWRRKIVWVRSGAGWRAGVSDLHHAAGILFLPMMLMLSVTAAVMSFTRSSDHPRMHPAIVDIHTSRKYSSAVKFLYVASGAGFLIQGTSGVLLWWLSSSVRQQSTISRAIRDRSDFGMEKP
jgi:uncharacterized iron-regulated membrane protein